MSGYFSFAYAVQTEHSDENTGIAFPLLLFSETVCARAKVNASAAIAVSTTASAPNAVNAAASFPTPSSPRFIPSFSVIDTRTAGVICTATNVRSLLAVNNFHVFSIATFSVSSTILSKYSPIIFSPSPNS